VSDQTPPQGAEIPPPAADAASLFERDGKHLGNPLAEMFTIAAPTVITMTSYTVMQFIDGMMVSRIQPPDPVYVAAQGNGGMFVWLMMAFGLGMTQVINTYVAQHLGAGRPERGAAYAWNGLWICAALAILMLPAALVQPTLARAMGHSPQLQQLEVAYANILIAGAFLTLAGRTIAQFFYGLHRPLVVMVSVLLANLINVIANALLIYGEAGPPEGTPFAAVFRDIAQSLSIPALGVTGAALGTVIGTAIEFAIPMLVFFFPMNAKYHTRRAWRISRTHLRQIVKIGWPGAAMWLNELFCWGYLMSFLIPLAGRAAGHSGDLHNSAGWIALRYMHVSFMPAMGLSIAVTALVGRCMGMGRPDLAAKRAWLGLAITTTYMGLCALAFVLFRREMIEIWAPNDLAPETAEQLVVIGATIMIAAAVFQVFDALAITLSGALRGAGDTIWPGLATVVLSWLCIVGGGHTLIALAPNLGSLGPWIGAASYITLPGFVLPVRLVLGRWKSIQLIDHRVDVGEAKSFGDGTISLEDEPLSTPADAAAGVTPGAV